MTKGRWPARAYEWALIAYPRAFRRRFGAEMRDHIRRQPPTWRQAGRLVIAGLAERASEIERRLFWPAHRAHIYESSGRISMMWDTFRSDLRQTIRLALKSPLFTSLTILTLALGIGATSAIVALVEGVLIEPLPYRDSSRLVHVWSDASRLGRPRNTISPANFRDFQRMNTTLEGLEAYFSFVTPLELDADGASEVTMAVMVTPGLFDVLGRRPILGRTFQARDEVLEVMLSHGYWQRRFGGDEAVVGRRLEIEGFPAHIVGVMPPDFTFPYGTMLGPSGFTRTMTADLWAPIAFEGPIAAANRMLTPQGQLVRGVHWFGAIGRMKPGVTVEQVQADVSTVASQLAQTYPDTNTGWGATVVPVLEQTVGNIRAPLLVLLAGVACVLLIAVVNVANLVLARSVARQKELATRVALGAGRARIVQQSLTEGLVLAAGGGLAGFVLGRWAISALVALAPADLPRVHEIAPDTRLWAITAAVALIAGVLVSVAPALAAARVAPHAALQDSSRGTVGSAFRHRLRGALVVGQLALAVTLTIGAGLLLRSFVSLLAVNPGFQPEHLLTWQMNLPDRLKTQDERTAFYREFLTRMRALPGVVSVGGTTRLPLGSTGLTTRIDVEGRPRPNAEWPEVQFRRAIGDFFQTMGIPLLRGRTFTDADGPSTPSVCIVNQTLAAKVFPGEDPLGRRVRLGPSQPWTTIIGVVADIKHSALDETPAPEMYVSHLQGQVVSPYMVMRTVGDPAAMVDLVRAEARAIDRDLPLYRIETMEAVRSDSVAQQRFVLVLIGVFGIVALVLAAIGVYGMMSLLVSERTQEVGVRLALGAYPRQVLTLLLGRAGRLAALGIALGLGLSFAVMPLLRSQLYAVEPYDGLTMAGVPAALILVAFVAALVPARRALHVNPVDALRYE